MARRPWLWLLGVLISTAGACGSGTGTSEVSPEQRSEGRVAVDGEALQPPGTELAPGVEVQAGSALVATSMPAAEFHREPGSVPEELEWQAVLVIDGDPVEVWDRYVAELGLNEADARESCVVQAVGPATPQEAVDGTRQEPSAQRSLSESPLDRLTCHAEQRGTTMGLAMGAMPCLDYKAEEPPCELHAASHLYIRVLHRRADIEELLEADRRRAEEWESKNDSSETINAAPPATEGALTALREGALVSRLPEEGERYDDRLDYYLDKTDAALVPDGGRSLVAPAILLDCNSGLVALLEVPGSPSEVVHTFDQADDRDHDLIGVDGTDAQGRSWAGGSISTAGGYYLDLVALDTGDATSTVLITECGD